MNDIQTSIDPRYAIFQKLLDCIKNKRPQYPYSINELDTRLYTDEKWFEYEKEKLFSDVPLIVGFSSMVKEAGDHFTFDLAGKPMLVVRGKDGKLRCFLNVCRHRGVRLSNASEITKTKTFSCPYHHWTYDLEGRLIFVPTEESFPGLDKSCKSLKELAIEEAHGFIWVNPKLGGSINLPSFLKDIATDLDNFGLAESHFFKQNVHTVKANWKLIIEAFLDGYHVTRLHNKTVGDFFLDNQAVQDVVKPHIRSAVARTKIMEVMDAPESEWNFRQHASFSHFIWPNTITIMHPDYSSQLSLFPTAFDETIAIHNCVVNRKPESEKEQAHFERGFAIIDRGVFVSEDFHVCEQAQIGMASGANDTLLAGGHEFGLRTFHEMLEEELGAYRSEI